MSVVTLDGNDAMRGNGMGFVLASDHVAKYILKITIWSENPNKTSMMRQSQNFLLHNGTIVKIKVNEWINN